MNELVSVIIPAFNAENTISRAIDSVLAQTYSPVEVIVVDDGSADSTQRICESYGDEIIYIHQENKGVSAARNKGIQTASGEYIGFLDADDWYLPDKLQQMMPLFAAYPDIKAVTCTYLVKTVHGVKLASAHEKIVGKKSNGRIPLFTELAKGRPVIHTNTVLIRSFVFKTVGLFNEAWRFGEDIEMWIRIAGLYEWLYLDKPLCVYDRTSVESVCSRISADQHGLDFLYTNEEMERFIRPEFRQAFIWFRETQLVGRLHVGLIYKNRDFVKLCCNRLHGSHFRLEKCSMLVRYFPEILWPKITKCVLLVYRMCRKIRPA